MEPITDSPTRLVSDDPAGPSTEELIDHMRGAVLRDVLPAPDVPVPVEEIVAFKRDHDDKLLEFRRHVEPRLTGCAQERDPVLRDRLVEHLRDELADGIAELEELMSRRRWPTARGTLGVAIRSLPAAPAAVEAVVEKDAFLAAGAITTVLAAVLEAALDSAGGSSPGPPLAYAALAGLHFG
jgi:hypothetical protein